MARLMLALICGASLLLRAAAAADDECRSRGGREEAADDLLSAVQARAWRHQAASQVLLQTERSLGGMQLEVTGPANDCEKQDNCIRVSVTKADTDDECAGEDCSWTACLTYDKASGCPASVSHTCRKPKECPTEDLDFVDGSTAFGVDNPDTCQTGKGGDVLSFLIKDGKGCSGSNVVTGDTDNGGTYRCAPRNSSTASCTGNAVGSECIWNVTLPECPTTTTAAPAPATAAPTTTTTAAEITPAPDTTVASTSSTTTTAIPHCYESPRTPESCRLGVDPALKTMLDLATCMLCLIRDTDLTALALELSEKKYFTHNASTGYCAICGGDHCHRPQGVVATCTLPGPDSVTLEQCAMPH